MDVLRQNITNSLIEKLTCGCSGGRRCGVLSQPRERCYPRLPAREGKAKGKAGKCVLVRSRCYNNSCAGVCLCSTDGNVDSCVSGV